MKQYLFKAILACAVVIIVIVCGAMLFSLSSGSIEAFERFGIWGFISGTEWNPSPENEQYGALPFILGTLMTSILALMISISFALSIALFNGEYFKGTKLSIILSTLIDLLAGVPSVIYGLWGFYTVRPIIVNLGLSEQGFAVATAAIVLAIMIIPYAASLSAEFITMVNHDLKEGAYSLGATRLEVLTYVIIPNAMSGVFASFTLAFGRAMAETMAVTMLIGNTNQIITSIFDSGNTMASVIANQFGEANDLRLSSLIAIGLLLFLITAAVNAIGRLIMRRLH